MKKKLSLASFVAAAALAAAFPHLVLAHEHQIFKIGAAYYEFTIGSLNEAVTVDDKTGVDLRVKRISAPSGEMDHGAMAMADGETEDPVTGLESTLKVELAAGGQKKILDLRPAFNNPGAYTAPFYPTIQTTYMYRVFGMIDGMPVDLSFTCNPAGHPQVDADTNKVEISEGVMRVEKSGSFGCPVAKADMGFPTSSASLNELEQDIAGIDARMSDFIPTAQNVTYLALGVAVVGLIVGLIALFKGQKMS